MANEQQKNSILTSLNQQRIAYPWKELCNDDSLSNIPLFSYGSLVNPNSAKRTLQYSNTQNMLHAVSYGIRRVFNYRMPKPFYDKYVRNKELDKVAALNVEVTKKSSDRINGAVIQVNAKDLKALAQREEGYDLQPITYLPWHNRNSPSMKAYILTASSESKLGASFIDSDIRPAAGYLELCLNAVDSVSEEFGLEFRKTSYLTDGRNILELEAQGY